MPDFWLNEEELERHWEEVENHPLTKAAEHQRKQRESVPAEKATLTTMAENPTASVELSPKQTEQLEAVKPKPKPKTSKPRTPKPKPTSTE